MPDQATGVTWTSSIHLYILLPDWFLQLALCPDPTWGSVWSLRTNHWGILELQLVWSLTMQIVDTNGWDEIFLQGVWPHFTFQSEELSDLGGPWYQASNSSERSQLRCLGASLWKYSGQDKLGGNPGHTQNMSEGLHIPSVLGALRDPQGRACCWEKEQWIALLTLLAP